VSDFKYFDVEKILSRGALVSVIISNRGVGKTFSAKQRVLRRFRKKGEKFLFLKRSEEELKATVDSFFDDVSDEHTVFKYSKFRFYIGDRHIEKDEEGVEKEIIEWRLLGYASALSTITKLKGISPQDVTTILWDEFVAYDGRYLPNEGQRLLDIIETVDRTKERVQVVALGNKNENGYYPVIHELGAPIASDFEDDKIYSFKSGTLIVYSFTNVDYVKHKANSRIGKLAKGTDYYESMIKNNKQSNFGEYVIARPQRLTLRFSIVCRGEMFNVYHMKLTKEGMIGIYVEETGKPAKYIYTTDNASPTVPKLAGNGFNMIYGYIVSNMARFDTQVSAQRVIEAIISKRR
jgi:hypothetical protein